MNLISLGDCVKYFKGFAFKSEWYSVKGIPIIKVSDFTDDGINTENLSNIRSEFLEEYKKYAIYAGDILIQTVGSWPDNPNSVVGKVVKASMDINGALLNQNAVNLIPLHNVDKTYLYFLLKDIFFKRYIINTAQGAANQASITLDSILGFKFCLPKLDIQSKIASILSTYNELIEVNNQRIKLLEETGRELYKEWFIRMRFPRYKKARFKKGIPNDWQVKKLGEVIELAYGKALKEEDRIEGPNLVYGSSGIVGTHTQYLSKAPGIVVGRKGNVGSVFWVSKDFYPIDTAFFVKTKLSLYYIYYNLQNQHFIEGDAAVPGLNRNQAYSNSLLIPPDDLLLKFTSVVKPIFDFVINLEEQNTQLRQIRDRLLPRLISGKLQVKPLENIGATQSIASKKTNTVAKKVQEDKSTKSKPYFQRRVLAAYIIDRLKDEATFGHVKLMKLMYLCEHLSEIETASHYHRDAAGPYDNQMIRSIDSQLKKAQWFDCKKVNNKYQYTALPKKEEYKGWFAQYYSDKETGIESLLYLFGKEKTEKAEMVATLYEAWRDLKEKKQIPSDKAIIHEVLNNWHESKQRIAEERWLKCLQWMKRKGWIN